MTKYLTSYAKRLELFGVLAIAIVLSVTVIAVQQMQYTRQEAAEGQDVNNQNYQILSGYVYIDQNRNGERDLEEKGYSGALVNISSDKRKTTPSVIPTKPPVVPTYIINGSPMPLQQESTVVPSNRSDSLGYFKYKVASHIVHESVNYTVTLQVPSGYSVTTKNPQLLEGLGKKAKRILEFGIVQEVTTVTPLPTIYCDKFDPITGKMLPCTTPIPTTQACLQVQTWGRNIQTKECRLFSNSCMPAGWLEDKSCSQSPTPIPTNIGCPAVTPPMCANGRLIKSTTADGCTIFNCVMPQ